MASAEVGDDMVGEDPTVNRLEAMMAELLEKQAAVFACSGTQSNQMAVWSHCHRGHELLIEESGHIGNYEAGGPAVLSGVMVRRIPGDFGRLDLPQLEGQIRRGNYHYAETRLLCLENSTNIGGGRTYPLEQIERVSAWAHDHGLKVHLDGARLFNACLARGYEPRDVARHVDTISICFSKGLGCPMGSILIGSREEIHRARQARKVFGGALRQAGIVAAAALYALEHHIDRLADDHKNARLLAESIATVDGIRLDPSTVETNLVFFEIDPSWGTAADLCAKLKARDVLMIPLGVQRLRACTHLDVSREEVLKAAAAVREAMSEPPGQKAGSPESLSAYGSSAGEDSPSA